MNPRTRNAGQFVLLFLPVAVAIVGLAVPRSNTVAGIAILALAGIWMLASFVIRHRREIR